MKGIIREVSWFSYGGPESAPENFFQLSKEFHLTLLITEFWGLPSSFS